MTYDAALNRILSKRGLGIMPGLARIMALLDKMDNPQDKIKIIHIAGTNGKGTVASTIASALQDNGLKVGLFTSPYITDYREQIQINGAFIPENVFSDYVERYSDNDCTEFELLTAIMYKYFSDEAVDFAVVECGMGGKGDATNVERENVCSVLTSISLDHTDFLGNTIEEITREKEGIVRSSPCFRIKKTGNIDNDNLELAKRVVAYLGYSSDICLVKPIARQQRINNILIDGGHNVDAALVLAPLLDDEVALIGMMADKNADGYLSLVAPKCKMIITTTPDNPRSMPSDRLCALARKYCNNVISVDNPVQALSVARKHNLSLVCGSFYLIREILKDLY